MNLKHEMNGYALDLDEFIAHERLPRQWFDKSDHVGFKMANAVHFERVIEQIKIGESPAEEIYCTTMGGRRLAIAMLAAPLCLGKTWEVDLLELMEPKPGKVGRDKVGIDHAEFLVEEFEPIETRLAREGVAYDLQSNTSHQWISVVFGSHGQRELKFTDQSLKDILALERHQGTAATIYTREP